MILLTYVRSKEDLESDLKEQIGFLINSAKAFDDSMTSEAKRMAIVIRILVHDTQNSISLLTQLEKKDILFYDTALDPSRYNLGLVGIVAGKEVGYDAPLDNGAPIRYVKGKVEFQAWWEEVVIKDKLGNTLTRKELILSVCNKDGGAHIDPKLSKSFADITRRNSLDWRFFKNGEEEVSRIELFSIRQISHEILKSLEDGFPDLFNTE